MNKLYAYVSGVNLQKLLSINISSSHNAATAIAVITCEDHLLNIGDLISIQLGYVDDYNLVFTGYVKQIERKVPDNIYTITAYDTMTRALDYFVAADDPSKPFSKRNISAENLVRSVLALAGLTDFQYDPTYFTLAINTAAEVNLISAYDYCKSIADIVTWSMWADTSGVIQFRNRKPFVMTGDTGQPGDDTDERIIYGQSGSVSIGKLINKISDSSDNNIISIEVTKSEADIRNKVVVYGENNSHATASSSSTYDPILSQNVTILPTGFYKTSVIASPLLGASFLNSIANYNLHLYNRVGYTANVSIIGNYHYTARNIITVEDEVLNYNNNWYIYSSELLWSASGFVNNLVLRR